LLSLDTAVDRGATFEVIVSVDGATDGTGEMLRSLRPTFPLTVLDQPNRGPAAARNRAMAEAAGDVQLFLDDDVVPSDGLVERHLQLHRTHPRAVGIGPMLGPVHSTMAPWLRWEAKTLDKQYRDVISGRYAPTPRQFYTANASVARDDALAIGGFDETFTRAEDVEFAYRLRDRGLSFYFISDAAVIHEPHRTFEAWLRVGYEYGRHAVRMAQAGRPDDLRTAFREWPSRHPLNRIVPRWCVGRPARFSAASRALTAVARFPSPNRFAGAQLAACSALFNLQYWQGIADATGRGSAIWHDVANAIHSPGGDELRLAQMR
jgi:GT2 family glycosyltransferase